MGNREEFRAFYDAEFLSLRRLAYRLTGDWHEAQDLAQDAMLRTLRAWKRAKTNSAPAYARAILVNRHRSVLRRARVEAKHLVARSSDTTTEPVASAEHVSMWAELAELPLRQRQAIVLHYYEDLPQTQIAEILGCAQGTVNSLIFRGLARLRERIGPQAEPEALRSESR